VEYIAYYCQRYINSLIHSFIIHSSFFHSDNLYRRNDPSESLFNSALRTIAKTKEKRLEQGRPARALGDA